MTDSAPDAPQSGPPSAPPEGRSSFWIGLCGACGLALAMPLALTLGGGLLAAPFAALSPTRSNALMILPGLGALAFFAVGLAQWFWIVPFARRAAKHGLPERAKGLYAGAALVFLLNAGCWGLIGFASYHR